MDCRTTQDRLRWLPPGGSGASARIDEELKTHLLDCGLCRAIHESRDHGERLISAQIANVPIPVGAQERLLKVLADSSAAPRPMAAVPTKSRSQRAWVVSTLAGLLLAVAVGLGWHVRQHPQFTLESVRQSVASHLETQELATWPNFDGSFAPVVADSSWQAFLGQQVPLGIDLDQRTGHDAAAYLISAGSARGILIVVPTQRLVDPPVVGGEKMFYDSRTALAWRVGDQVYLCISVSGDLQPFLRRMSGPTA